MERRAAWDHPAPAKPIQNAFIASVSGKLRDEELNEVLFASLANARIDLAEWQHDYCTVSQRSKLGARTPAEIAKQAGAHHQTPGPNT